MDEISYPTQNSVHAVKCKLSLEQLSVQFPEIQQSAQVNMTHCIVFVYDHQALHSELPTYNHAVNG